MASDAPDIAALLDAWRTARADAPASLRSRRIEALSARAGHYQGAARRRLDARIAALIEADGSDGADDNTAIRSAQACERTVPRPLADLLAHLARRRAAAMPASGCVRRDEPDPAGTGAGAGPDAHAFPALPALDDFRATWTRVRAESQVRATASELPADAGPMHSTVLVHRAIALMREASPDYLQHVLTYLDALSGLQTMADSGAFAAPRSTEQDGSAARPRRSASRRPR
ncbi:DUF2894 domain-containing protein [Coralloluteibacterium stylophorae]|uniref:DUF2894 domain-containing protein n=1 Tax=Coralloluteibacterium stylophorae TaxID=1776034 RepID=A0A8J7VTH1_9GAMM|nr:DUF2894 domain-containing protein [Coralloluteibacterium stylophorae]MBS7456034.1 DUF2894 domain-containing protein [Coralloluteibacterium stylophorae]